MLVRIESAGAKAAAAFLACCVALLTLASPAGAQTEKKNVNPPKSATSTKQEEVDFPATLPPDPGKLPVKWTGKPRKLLAPNKLGDWEPINFGGEGDCYVKDSVLTIESGDPMTGVTFQGRDLPKTNYEIELEARRTGGIDFFCGLTFPVNDDHICLIVGGWAGAVVGLSNLDGEDASSNESRQLMTFKDNRWHRVRVRVMPERILVWIEDRCVIDQNLKGKQVSLRGDTNICRPLGICTFQTTSEVRNITLRTFQPVNDPSEPEAAQPPRKKNDKSGNQQDRP